MLFVVGCCFWGLLVLVLAVECCSLLVDCCISCDVCRLMIMCRCLLFVVCGCVSCVVCCVGVCCSLFVLCCSLLRVGCCLLFAVC